MYICCAMYKYCIFSNMKMVWMAPSRRLNKDWKCFESLYYVDVAHAYIVLLLLLNAMPHTIVCMHGKEPRPPPKKSHSFCLLPRPVNWSCKDCSEVKWSKQKRNQFASGFMLSAAGCCWWMSAVKSFRWRGIAVWGCAMSWCSHIHSTYNDITYHV